MLDVLRKNSRHWLVSAIIAIIIIGLSAFFGYSSRDSEQGLGWVVKVDGETVKTGEFLNRYRAVVENYRAKLGAGFDEKLLESLNIRSYILKGIVDEKLLAKEADMAGIKVSELQLRDNIMQYPAFQKDGKFSMEYYKSLLSYNRTKPAEFERLQMEELQRQKMREMIYSASKINDDEVLNDYRTENETIKLSYIPVNLLDASKAVKITKEEVEKFLGTEEGKKQASDYYSANNDKFIQASTPATPSKVKTFEEVKWEIAEKILFDNKQESINAKRTEDALKAANIEAVAKLLGQKIEQSAAFSRKASTVPSLSGSNINDVLWSFGIQKNRIYKRDIAGKTYIVSLYEQKFTPLKTNSPEFEQYKGKLIADRGSSGFMSFVNNLDKKWQKKIKYSPAFMQDMRGAVE